MTDYVIVLDSPTGMDRKQVRVFLEDNDEYRMIERNVRQEVEVDGYIQSRFAELWAQATPIAPYEWISATETEADELYRDVARAMIQAARGDVALTDVIAAAESEIAGSDRANAYSKLQTLASGASAAQRDAFFLVVAFMVIGKSAK